MKRAAIFSLIVLASIAVAKSDSDDDVFNYYFISQPITQSRQTCVPYGGDCTKAPCCQYYGRRRTACFSCVCLQAQCGYPGQVCGMFIGECCYHLGLYCKPHSPWEGTCVSSKGYA